MQNPLWGLLTDTWWFGLTQRLSPVEFQSLAQQRAEQGFSAIQLVVGIPPEVGPRHPSARSHAGFPWSLDGDINQDYLRYARDQISFLNDLGLTAVVYGAWGHQIDWLGPERMGAWWAHIVQAVDDLDVIYCLSGEINLWVGQSEQLLPDRSTGDLYRVRRQLLPRLLPQRLFNRLKSAFGRQQQARAAEPGDVQTRRAQWDVVLGRLASQTQRPIIVHPTANETGFESVNRPELLSANTAQTGHDQATRERIWRLPLSLLGDDEATVYINLEPWYEGIGDNFWTADQLFAYWASMAAGAASHGYGAHGIWNVGDGRFLAHWGGQTFDAARQLGTPRLLGLSHQQMMAWRSRQDRIENAADLVAGELVALVSRGTAGTLTFYPEIGRASDVPEGQIWLPLEGAFAGTLPASGQVVVISG